MKIYLINPEYPLSFWDFNFCRDLDGSEYPHYSLALPTLAALTPEQHSIEICDENVQPIDFDVDADIIAVTAYITQKERAIEIANRFKQRGLIVVLGGPIVDLNNRQEFLKQFDVVFQGEAEYTWPQFLGDYVQGGHQTIYHQQDYVDMNDSPLPRYTALDLNKYSSAIVETSRGCPYSCEFCEIPIRLGKKSRMKSINQVMAEVNELYSQGADSIFFIDDHFIGQRRRAIELLESLAEFAKSVDYAIYFTCQISINFSKDDELLALMNRANFKRVFIGLETPRRNIAGFNKKSKNLETSLAAAVRKIHSYGIIVWAGLIVGLDSDDREIFTDQMALIQSSSIPIAMIGILQAIPNTPLYSRLDDDGRVKSHEIGGIRGGYQGQINSNIVMQFSDGMTEDELVKGYQKLITRAYGYLAFAKRLLGVLRQCKSEIHVSPRALTAKEKNIIAKTLRYYLLSFDLRRPFLFLSMCAASMMINPRRIDQVLLHLIVYKHFREYYARVAQQ
ncbi:MAG: B12-binding domain-containing radical SAM protein [Gammaproteobacteria bacterium]|nr:B12-binding domain-containing radical SAM protein [Gammaproteobacteria bacterium]MCW8924612.1 B12-binding domain-containing radical SAM protein [Gammaproteobacteria bacterium]